MTRRQIRFLGLVLVLVVVPTASLTFLGIRLAGSRS